jgi:hypothetical protein
MALSVAKLIVFTDYLAAMFAAAQGNGSTAGCGDDTLTVADVAGAGTISSSGTVVTGAGSNFTALLIPGSYIKADGLYARVQMVISATKCIVAEAPSTPWSSDAWAVAADWGVHRGAQDILTALIGTPSVAGVGDADVITDLLAPARALPTNTGWQRVVLDLNAFVNALAQLCSKAGLTGVTDLDSFCTYYNSGAGGPFTCLMAPDFQALWCELKNGTYLSAKNVYAPPVGSLGSVNAATDVFTDGNTIDSVHFGGFTRLNIATTGFTGASGVVSIAVSGLKADGTAGTDTWTGTVAANGDVVVTAGSVVKIVQDVTGIVAHSNITAGTLTVTGLIPSGRTNPPAV